MRARLPYQALIDGEWQDQLAISSNFQRLRRHTLLPKRSVMFRFARGSRGDKW